MVKKPKVQNKNVDKTKISKVHSLYGEHISLSTAYV